MLTWKFKAQNVRDVAWAAAPNYLWDASAWEDVLAQAYYRPAAKATWSDGAKESRFSIKEYSEHWFRYPYPQISAVEGPVSGMEYPMLAMEANASTLAELYNVVTHEIGHNWFPMIVGSNERATPGWMKASTRSSTHSRKRTISPATILPIARARWDLSCRMTSRAPPSP